MAQHLLRVKLHSRGMQIQIQKISFFMSSVVFTTTKSIFFKTSVAFTKKSFNFFSSKSSTLAEGEAAWCARERSHRQSGRVGQRRRDTGDEKEILTISKKMCKYCDCCG